jgi:hypothetical protein
MPDASSFFDRHTWFSESAVQGHRRGVYRVLARCRVCVCVCVCVCFKGPTLLCSSLLYTLVCMTVSFWEMAAFREILDDLQFKQGLQMSSEAPEVATRRGGGRALAAAGAEERAAGGKRGRLEGRGAKDGEDGGEHGNEERGVSSRQEYIPLDDGNVGMMKDQSWAAAGTRRLEGEGGKRKRGARDVSPGESRHGSQGRAKGGEACAYRLVVEDEDKVENEGTSSWSKKMAATVGQVAAFPSKFAGVSVHGCSCVRVRA